MLAADRVFKAVSCQYVADSIDEIQILQIARVAMCDQNREVKKPKGKGRILRLRLGINPNSSGYGILWGAYFFLPPAVVSTLVTVIMDSWLRKALIDDAEEKTSILRKWTPIVPLLWGLAWAGFFAGWLNLIMRELSESYLLPGISILLTLVIAYLIWRTKDHPLLIKETVYIARVTFVLGIIGGVLIVSEMTLDAGLEAWITAITNPFLLPLALIYTATAVKFGFGISRIKLILSYIIMGFLSLLIFIPYVTVLLRHSTDYNAVGLLFFLWGWGGPPLLTILSLRRLMSKSHEITENPV
jgi:hypothetical protein